MRMFTFAKVLIVLALCVVGFGFYRGWFVLSSPDRSQESNKVDIKLTLDGDKVNKDVATVKEKTSELTGKATEEATEPADQETVGVKGNNE